MKCPSPLLSPIQCNPWQSSSRDKPFYFMALDAKRSLMIHSSALYGVRHCIVAFISSHCVELLACSLCSRGQSSSVENLGKWQSVESLRKATRNWIPNVAYYCNIRPQCPWKVKVATPLTKVSNIKSARTCSENWTRSSVHLFFVITALFQQCIVSCLLCVLPGVFWHSARQNVSQCRFAWHQLRHWDVVPFPQERSRRCWRLRLSRQVSCRRLLSWKGVYRQVGSLMSKFYMNLDVLYEWKK